MKKFLAMVLAASAFWSLSVTAAPVKMTSAALDKVTGGCETPTGNNGWGNGADGTNAGSGSGLTADSKLAGTNLTDATKVNTNPTTSTGR
ncbi:MAG: hypothetical protein V4508_25825 [Pseudomonadota bacterium]